MSDPWQGWILIIQRPNRKTRTAIYDHDQADDANQRASTERAAGAEVEMFQATSVPSARTGETQ